MLNNVKKSEDPAASRYIVGMRRKNKALRLIAAAAALSLVGLLAVQVLLIRQNFEWRRQAFRREANGALASVVEKLEAGEALKRIWTVSFLRKGQGSVALLSDNEDRPSLFLLPGQTVPKVQAEGGDVVLTLSIPQRVRLVVVKPLGEEDRTVLDEIRPDGRSVVPVMQLASRAGGTAPLDWIKLFLDDVQYDLSVDKGQIVSILAHPTVTQDRVALIDKVLEEYVVVDPAPIERKIDAAELAGAVGEALREREITAECVYGVIPAGTEEVLLASDDSRRDEILRSEFRTRLFPDDVSVAAADLAIFFPTLEGSPFPYLGTPAVVALVFLLAAGACLVAILRAVAVQKRTASAMADFVNNMTHEFKTPISTISLACDTLGQEPVRADAGRRTKYEEMIRSECLRMQGQIRKILETAALERGELDLRFERTDAHSLIRKSVEAFSMIVGSRGGSITTRLEAGDPFVEVDPVHFRNVLHNLLDNAVQYTRRPPEIVVATQADEGGLRITVTDNGVGLNPEERKRIFERYYRVSTGNVHDVKGFGLGLSYVKLIVKGHGGSVAVRSEEGKGSTFEIGIPFRQGGTKRKNREKTG
jgi:signal transduction histidine kinase